MKLVSIMIYPPGIPMLIPGEYITRDFIEDMLFYEEMVQLFLVKIVILK